MIESYAITYKYPDRYYVKRICKVSHNGSKKCLRIHDGDPRIVKVVSWERSEDGDLRFRVSELIRQYRKDHRRTLRQIRNLIKRPCSPAFLAWRNAEIESLNKQLPTLSFDGLDYSETPLPAASGQDKRP